MKKVYHHFSKPQCIGFIILFTAILIACSSNSHSGVLIVSNPKTQNQFQMGVYKLVLQSIGERWQFKILKMKSSPKIIFGNLQGRAFLSGAQGQESVHEARGSFFIKDQIKSYCSDQTIEKFEQTRHTVILEGKLICQATQTKHAYQIIFTQSKDGHLRMESVIEGLNRSYLVLSSSSQEGFFGFGEQFSHFNMKGRKLPIFVMEQGIGRGDQPITAGANLMADSGGDWHTTYAGVPHFISSELRSFWLENTEYSSFDMQKEDRVIIEVFSDKMTARLVAAQTPLELIESYTKYSGRMRTLPDWIHKGAIIGMQGGTQKVREVLAIINKHNIPVSAFWLQDWEGQRTTSFGKQLWWNWELDRDHYHDWENLKTELEKNDISILTYINPFLADVSEKKNAKRNLFIEAKDRDFLIKNKTNEAYMILNTSFSAGLLDLSNPEARTWIKTVIKENMINTGARGWMADFGEALPYDAKMKSADAKSFHNEYPEVWAQLNREAIKEAGRGDDIVFFSRSGYTKSPGKTTLFWLGDQMVSFDRHDGIKSAITGLLSSGLSGYSLNHSDTGGYTTIDNPLKDYHRSRELFYRWTELSAFTLLLRTHEGNRPNRNHQVYTDDETLEFFGKFAKIYAALFEYRQGLITEAAQRGWPVVRHPWLHYPEDAQLQKISYEQFMLGSEFMIVPVLDDGADTVEVYLPKGKWVHLWSKKVYGSDEKSVRFEIGAKIGEPAVFYKEGSAAGVQLQTRLTLPD